MVLGSPFTCFCLRVQPFQLLSNPRGQTIPHDIVGVATYDLGPVHSHAFPLPIPKPEDFLVELIGETLRPLRTFSEQVLVQDLLKCLPIPNLLTSGCLINQRSDADMRKSAHEHFARGRRSHLGKENADTVCPRTLWVWCVRVKCRLAFGPCFRSAQLLRRCKTLCLHRLAQAAPERQRPLLMCGNGSRSSVRLRKTSLLVA